MTLEERARIHAALGDPGRLHVVELLANGDLTVGELEWELDVPGNLLAHHLRVLEEAGVIERRASDADRRRRYVILRRRGLDGLGLPRAAAEGRLLFVCSHNSARSQYAAAYWGARTGQPAESAGSEPAAAVHPTALRVARERGIDLGAAAPRGYSSVGGEPDLLISVCDRAREGGLPSAERRLHWSIPDPVVSGKVADFRSAFTEIETRVDTLAGRT